MEAIDKFLVFRDFGEDSDLLEIASAGTVDEAKAIMRNFAQQMPGCYFVWDSTNSATVEYIGSALPFREA